MKHTDKAWLLQSEGDWEGEKRSKEKTELQILEREGGKYREENEGKKERKRVKVIKR